jgi:hypothetical protein
LVNDRVYLTSDVLLFAETWTKSSQQLPIQGFNQVARIDVEGATAKAYGSIYYLNCLSRLTDVHNSFSRNYTDQNGHHLSLSSFVVQDIMITSIYISPQCSIPRRIEVLQEILSMAPEKKIIAGDFTANFNQTETNSVTELFSSYGLYSALTPSIISTTQHGTYIDNIFTNVQYLDAGRYISFTSDHDPLFLQFNV